MHTHQIRYIRAGHCIDGSGAKAQNNVLLTVENGIITAIEPQSARGKTEPAPLDDLSHCTIVAPLVDCSVALARSPSIAPHPEASRQLPLITRHIRYLYDHGVLGVADGDTPEVLVRQYLQTTAHEPPVSYCFSHDPNGGFERVNSSADVMLNDRNQPHPVGEKTRDQRHQYEFRKIIVVANGPQAVAEALDRGCDAIEQGYRMGTDNIKRMAEQQILWIPSLLAAKNGLDSSGSGGDVCCRFSLRYVAPGQAQPGVEALWKQMLTEQFAQLQLARELGVSVAVGTGAGRPGILHGESVVEEIKLLLKAGYSLEEALHCATETGARFFNMEQLGALQVGKPATFLVTRGTPHQLPRKLAYLENIYLNGQPSSMYRKNPVKVGR